MVLPSMVQRSLAGGDEPAVEQVKVTWSPDRAVSGPLTLTVSGSTKETEHNEGLQIRVAQEENLKSPFCS